MSITRQEVLDAIAYKGPHRADSRASGDLLALIALLLLEIRDQNATQIYGPVDAPPPSPAVVEGMKAKAAAITEDLAAQAKRFDALPRRKASRKTEGEA